MTSPEETQRLETGIVPIARGNLSEQVCESLTSMIMDHHIRPNTRLNVLELSRLLGVSQTPVREALVRLEAEGLVYRQPMRGYFTTPLLDAREFDELFDFREHLEPWAAAAAASRLTDDGATQLRAEMTGVQRLGSGSEYESYKSLSAHDSRLHTLLFELAGNTRMREAFTATRCHLHLFRLHYGSSLGSSTLAEHHRIVQAVTARDPDAAAEAMREHLRSSRERLRPTAPPPST